MYQPIQMYCLMPHFMDSQIQIKYVHIELLLDSVPLVGYSWDSHYLTAVLHHTVPTTGVNHCH